MLYAPCVEPTPRVKMEDVARTAGVSVATVSKVVNGRYGVAQARSPRVQEVIDELGYEASLGARSPAQPPHQRPRHPGRRVRAVQHRAAQGRVLRRRLDRLRAARLLRRWPRRRRRLGAALPVAAVRHADRRRDHRDPHGRRGEHRRPGRGGRPAHRPDRPAHRRLRQLRRRGPGHRAPHRARAPPDRLPRRAPGPRVRPAARGRLPQGDGHGRPPGRRVPGRRRRVPPGDRRRRRPASCWARPTGPPRSSPRTTSPPSR